ncbi:MAG: hypothetical protein V2I26_17360 [Halieaceae bacterium]|jgi:hypothetical protein|nr:hypothetical protein [Halieaceae bacterium]
MRPVIPGSTLGRLLLALTLATSPALWAEGYDTTDWNDTVVDEQTEQSLLDAISRLESRDGAYSADLPEHMLSLGLALQQQERHGEAVDVFKRGVHLARINNGLYCPEQIPLLNGEIRSSIALGEYARVDDLQQYLYRVQVRGQASGEQRAAALLQQADWHFNAYQLGIGEQGAERLMAMWELYRLAWSDINSTLGETAPELLPPLYGLLRTQYLISEYRADSEPQSGSFHTGYGNTDGNRFYTYRSENYDLGRSVIMAIYQVQQTNHGADSDEALGALVALGDWALWHDKRADATRTYQLALAELAQRDAAKEAEAGFLVEPVPLPDIKGLHRLPTPVEAGQGNILVEFGVDERGEVTNLETLDADSDIEDAAARLLRVLRNTKFRPRFVAGEPAGTDKLVRAYDIKP